MRFEFRFESLKSISVLILFAYKLMIGSSKNNRENYPRKCFWTQEKETQVKFNPRLSANWLSNNWALDCDVTIVIQAYFPTSTQWLVASYFGICSHLLYILFIVFIFFICAQVFYLSLSSDFEFSSSCIVQRPNMQNCWYFRNWQPTCFQPWKYLDMLHSFWLNPSW